MRRLIEAFEDFVDEVEEVKEKIEELREEIEDLKRELKEVKGDAFMVKAFILLRAPSLRCGNCGGRVTRVSTPAGVEFKCKRCGRRLVLSDVYVEPEV